MAGANAADSPAYAVTSGTHSAGALEDELWDDSHYLDWHDRALLQGVEDPEITLNFPPGPRLTLQVNALTIFDL